MTIFRPKKIKLTATDPDVPVADFSYQNDSLAQMIVDAWVDDNFRTLLLSNGQTKALLSARGIYLSQPVVISEDDYNNGYYKHDDAEVVFVLPNKEHAQLPAATGLPGPTLLETARLLMASIPNGI